jgi:hypothetical protein
MTQPEVRVLLPLTSPGCIHIPRGCWLFRSLGNKEGCIMKVESWIVGFSIEEKERHGQWN